MWMSLGMWSFVDSGYFLELLGATARLGCRRLSQLRDHTLPGGSGALSGLKAPPPLPLAHTLLPPRLRDQDPPAYHVSDALGLARGETPVADAPLSVGPSQGYI